MADLTGFDARQVEPAIEMECLPAGKYEAVITESEFKPTKSGTGSYLQLTFQITEGEYKNRLLWTRLNLDNPNAMAIKIAQAELSAICRAVEVMAPGDSTDLHDLPLMISVRCRKRQDTGEIVNEIRGYSKKETPPPAAMAAPSNNTAPWKRP
ncbi:MAG: DUF669 domain-containing protein [Pirellulales bacterium]|nr:DUF669 domain-containing protein [Pirellulales bacterium]